MSTSRWDASRADLKPYRNLDCSECSECNKLSDGIYRTISNGHSVDILGLAEF